MDAAKKRILREENIKRNHSILFSCLRVEDECHL